MVEVGVGLWEEEVLVVVKVGVWVMVKNGIGNNDNEGMKRLRFWKAKRCFFGLRRVGTK